MKRLITIFAIFVCLALAVQAEALKSDSKAVVMGYAYANYVDPPIKTRLNDQIVIGVELEGMSRADESDVMHLLCEAEKQDQGLADAIADSLRAICKLKGTVALVPPGSLPNDGKVIDDQRRYE